MAVGFVIQFPFAISNSRLDLWVFSERQELQGEAAEEKSALLPRSLLLTIPATGQLRPKGIKEAGANS